MKFRILTILLSLSFAIAVQADDITGLWRTVDEEGLSKSIVEIYQQGGEYFGRITELLLDPEGTVCSRCSGDDKDQRVKGMVIIKNLQEKNGKYSGGTILDPVKGKQYRTKIWVEGDILQVRGYLGMFFRTQAWYRYQEGELSRVN